MGMENSTSLDEIKPIVYRKAGRNLHLFQVIESILKMLTATGRYQGPISQLNSILAKQNALTEKKTMGMAVHTLDKTFSNFPAECTPPDDLKEIWVSFSLNIAPEFGEANTIIEDLSTIVPERNYLAHQFFLNLNQGSIDSWIEAEHYLDTQREKILPYLEYLQGVVASLRDCRAVLAQFFDSDEWLKILEEDQET